MEVVEYTLGKNNNLSALVGKEFCATIGFFDGVHLGHQFLLQNLSTLCSSTALHTMVITFSSHPRQVLQKDYIPQLLSLNNRKTELLNNNNIDIEVLLDFTSEMASLPAKRFIEILHHDLHVTKLLIGYDNRFGKRNPDEGFEQYRKYGKEVGVEVIVAEQFQTSHQTNVSSSEVRRLLLSGNIQSANSCLGYRYCYTGEVVHGYGEGRKLGFPTANMKVDRHQLIPKRGVYSVIVHIEDDTHTYAGMMNIGVRPTYGNFTETNEVHILNFDRDIYGKNITVEFVDRIRDEKKFSSLDELKKQLIEDEKKCNNSL